MFSAVANGYQENCALVFGVWGEEADFAHERIINFGLRERNSFEAEEGMVGTPLVVGLNRGPHRAVMQIPGSGLKVKSALLIDILRSRPEMRLIWNRCVLVQGLQVAQIAAILP